MNTDEREPPDNAANATTRSTFASGPATLDEEDHSTVVYRRIEAEPSSIADATVERRSATGPDAWRRQSRLCFSGFSFCSSSFPCWASSVCDAWTKSASPFWDWSNSTLRS